MTTKDLSALANKTKIVPTKSKNKFRHEEFSFRLLHLHKNFKAAKIRQRLICSKDRPE